MSHTELSKFDNNWYDPGRGIVVRALWYLTNVLFFICPLNPFSGLKVALLRLFGAKVGSGVNIKPSVNIKYPWRLSIGNYVWIGERVWIDNLDMVAIGDNCCISQQAMLLCGNHDYKKSAFDLMTAPITLEDGVWVGARALVCPGTNCSSHSVVSAGSVVSGRLEAFTIYGGNPAKALRQRKIAD